MACRNCKGIEKGVQFTNPDQGTKAFAKEYGLRSKDLIQEMHTHIAPIDHFH